LALLLASCGSDDAAPFPTLPPWAFQVIDAGASAPGDGDGVPSVLPDAGNPAWDDGDGDGLGDDQTGDFDGSGDGIGDEDGTPDAGGGDGTGDGGGDGSEPSMLPQVKGSCPALKDGNVSLDGATVRLWVGSKPGPLYMYFHGTGTSPGEIDQGIPGATSSVKSEGGIAASWDQSNGRGTTTGTIWYTGDLEAADQLVACGIEQGLVDTTRIHVAGYSAGGLQTGAFIVERAN
jgi:hypothetical protein